MSKAKFKVKSYGTKKQADNALLEQLKQFPEGSKPIMCECEKCGGIGFAQDETLLDQSGYLKDMQCPCGGRIKKVF